jgi:uncharacterized membrane protein YidH (DUF202 family)
MPVDKPYKPAIHEQLVESAEVELDTALALAFTRTELTSDNTLLAWVRTALAMMAAGIAYDKAFLLLHDERLAAGTAWVRSANFAGILVTGISVVLLVIATVRHLRIARSLAEARRRGIGGSATSLLAAILVILMGCAVFVFLVVTG